MELLNGILRLFIKSGKEAQLAQSENLASIIFEGSHFGYLLFSQPAIWVFRWDRKNLSHGAGVIEGPGARSELAWRKVSCCISKHREAYSKRWQRSFESTCGCYARADLTRTVMSFLCICYF